MGPDGVTLDEVLWIKAMVRLQLSEAGARWTPLGTNTVSNAARATIGKARWEAVNGKVRRWVVSYVRRAYGLEYIGVDGRHYNQGQEGPRDTVPTKTYPGSDTQICAYAVAESGGGGDGGEPGAGAAVVGAGGVSGVGGVCAAGAPGT